MKTALVIGLGMGQQYQMWLAELGYKVFTCDIDPNKKADYITPNDAVVGSNTYDLVYIGTPNYTHEPIARIVAAHTSLLLIEKPGVINSQNWKNLVNDYPDTRIMMIKNNQYRGQIAEFKRLANQSEEIIIQWNNRNRIPYPGSWFTTKSKSFGGVSRDLIPHMLSYYCVLSDYKSGSCVISNASKLHNLESIKDTDYGIVDYNGTYDVDDFCELEFKNKNKKWVLTANWKNDLEDDSSIIFKFPEVQVKYQLGLCPKEAYQTMIKVATDNLDNLTFWQDQLEQDLWIHQQIENL